MEIKWENKKFILNVRLKISVYRSNVWVRLMLGTGSVWRLMLDMAGFGD